MPTPLRPCRRIVPLVVLVALCGGRVSAEEIWVAPTHQQDVGGMGVASNVVWPVTAIGAVRLALAIPDDMQTFQSAKIVLLPNSPSGAANLVVYVCGAQPGSAVTSNCSAATPHPFVGTASQLVEVDISAAVAARLGGPGTAYIGILAYSTPTTNSDRIVGMRFGYDALPAGNAATLGANTFTGTQTAPAFVGDGSGLTNLPAPANVATLGANTFSGTQTAPAFAGDGSGVSNVNATLLDGLDSTAFAAAGSTATLGANTFTGTQTINAGNLDLDPSTATTGLITRNGAAFLHNYGTANTFLGMNAGNVSMTGGSNTVMGYQAFQANTTGGSNTASGAGALQNNTTGNENTATGSGALILNIAGSSNTAVGANALQSNNSSLNTAVGWSSLRQNTTGVGNTATGFGALEANTTAGANTATGWDALRVNTTGANNTANGVRALRNNTTGHSNMASGTFALQQNTSGTENTASGGDALISNTIGSGNVGVGMRAGFNATTGSNNIYLGANVFGVAGEANTMYLGKVGTQTKTVIAGVRGTAVVGGEPVVIDADGRLGSGAVSPGLNTVGANEVINESLTADDLGPDSVGASEVAFNYAGSASEGGAATNAELLDGIDSTAFAAAVHGHDVSQVTNAARLAGGNTLTGAQTINAGNLNLDASTATTGNVTKNGALFLHNFGGNTFLGLLAGNVTMTGLLNTAIGHANLSTNTTGDNNTAVGYNALPGNTAGDLNTADGAFALRDNTTGAANTAIGAGTLADNTAGSNNSAIGTFALSHTTGGFNVAIGASAGINATTGFNNIYIGAGVGGVAGESNTMYLGQQGTQTKTFVAGIRGTTTGINNGVTVLIDGNGQLGTINSSRRFKQEIHDMGDASKRLLQLRPVTFRYTQAFAGGAKPVQYGLIAEEVAEVFPDLAVLNADGQPETVKYQDLSVLLLNELQKQQRRVETLERQLADVISRLAPTEADGGSR